MRERFPALIIKCNGLCVVCQAQVYTFYDKETGAMTDGLNTSAYLLCL